MTWDEYFYNICRDVGANSKCLSKKIGALIIKNNYIISTGYNGPPVGCMHCDNKNIDNIFLIKVKGILKI